jgi:predicted regulator of Ras-like GTPase activity (Roadblock/LC7/MglB family)
MEQSAFTDILADIEGVCPGFLAAVFYDREGEAIDYHSYLEPYATRLLAAHLVVVVHSAVRKFETLHMGHIDYMEIYGSRRDSISVAMGDELFLSVIVESGNLNQAVHRRIRQVIERLRREVNG